uniref:glycosyltransferase n=1 Tax=Chitinivorax sp. B TaxID=2502235 RepID=UPI0010F5299E
FPLTMDDRARIRARNGLHLLNLEQCDVAVAPTHWQKQVHPPAYHDKIQVIHEGIDVQRLGPDPDARFTLPNGKVLKPGDPVVTYVARNLEPYRGFHVFMRALPQLLTQHPTCDVVIVGGDGVSYGSKPKHAANWKETLLKEVSIDLNRVHFLGKLPYDRYRTLLQVSAAHVYLTYPFVLSWSMLEAMATGCLVIGSDTAPVREVLQHGVNGLTVPFFDPDAIAAQTTRALNQAHTLAPLRQAAQTTAQRYAVENGLAAYAQLLGQSASRNTVPPAQVVGGMDMG